MTFTPLRPPPSTVRNKEPLTFSRIVRFFLSSSPRPTNDGITLIVWLTRAGSPISSLGSNLRAVLIEVNIENTTLRIGSLICEVHESRYTVFESLRQYIHVVREILHKSPIALVYYPDHYGWFIYLFDLIFLTFLALLPLQCLPVVCVCMRVLACIYTRVSCVSVE